MKGREKLYLDSLWTGFSFDPKTFSAAKKDYFAKQYAAEGHMRAGFEWFRALPQDAKDNKELAKSKLNMPVLSVGGEKAMGQQLADTVKLLAPQAKTIVLSNTGHWLMEENPKATLQALEDFLKTETLK
ncbi:Soluble epoxide hydrolase [compost metagenome]